MKANQDGNYIFLPLWPKRPILDSRSEEAVCDTYAFDDEGNYITTKKDYEAYANTKLCKDVDCIKVDPPKEKEVFNINIKVVSTLERNNRVLYGFSAYF